jgi:hypothetical protein
MMALQKQQRLEDQQIEEEAASGGMPARCSDLCDPQKHVSSKVGDHWVHVDCSSVYSTWSGFKHDGALWRINAFMCIDCEMVSITVVRHISCLYNYCVSGHYPLSCFYLKHTSSWRLDFVSVSRWNLLSWA